MVQFTALLRRQIRHITVVQRIQALWPSRLAPRCTPCLNLRFCHGLLSFGGRWQQSLVVVVVALVVLVVSVVVDAVRIRATPRPAAPLRCRCGCDVIVVVCAVDVVVAVVVVAVVVVVVAGGVVGVALLLMVF